MNQNSALCQNQSDSVTSVSDLNYFNGVYCLGNYGEIFDKNFNGSNYRPSMNEINKGSGMLYSIPFGDSNRVENEVVPGPDPSSTFGKIRKRGFINCGVLMQDDFSELVPESANLTAMGVHYCKTLAAGIFNGDPSDSKIWVFNGSDDSSFFALSNRTVDVLVGGKVDMRYDLGDNPTLQSFTFSTPYFYGEGVSK